MLTEAREFACPYCGERNFAELEPDDAGQCVVQDCAVCCNPIELRMPMSEGDALDIRRELD
ncbi:MAG: CPXCG motif-containing cysteine-rich protein [Wenzhouxiangellaceae bacterium]